MLEKFRGMFNKGDARPQAQQPKTENPLEGKDEAELKQERTLDEWMDYFEELVGHSVLHNRNAIGDLESPTKLSLKDFLGIYGQASSRLTMTHSMNEINVLKALRKLTKE